MENQLQVFENEEFGFLRALLMNGETWFVGKDAAGSLGYSNTRDALIKHVDEEDKMILNQKDLEKMASESKGRETRLLEMEFDSPRGLTFINESGLYSLIFSSNLPKAKEFKRWVTSEVLPSIRKYGYYVAPNLENILSNMAHELTSDSAELACLTAQTPMLSLQIKAMMEKILKEYKKDPNKNFPIIEDLPNEIWKWFKGYEGLYQGSTYGRARSFFRGKCRLLIPSVSHRGYLGICLYKGDGTRKTFRLSRLIAETFIPNPLNLPEVHHKDDNKANNAVWNLEWVTGEQNREYAHKSGLYLKGEKNPSAKLTEEDVRWIREHYKANDPVFGNIALAERFKVSDVTITKIVTFRSWKHVQ